MRNDYKFNPICYHQMGSLDALSDDAQLPRANTQQKRTKFYFLMRT